jgi:hypothetical protein
MINPSHHALCPGQDRMSLLRNTIQKRTASAKLVAMTEFVMNRFLPAIYDHECQYDKQNRCLGLYENHVCLCLINLTTDITPDKT